MLAIKISEVVQHHSPRYSLVKLQISAMEKGKETSEFCWVSGNQAEEESTYKVEKEIKLLFSHMPMVVEQINMKF